MAARQVLPQFVVGAKGRKTAVIIPIEEYEELMEDIHDLGVVAERRHEPTVKIGELKRRLKRHGRA